MALSDSTTMRDFYLTLHTFNFDTAYSNTSEWDNIIHASTSVQHTLYVSFFHCIDYMIFFK